MGIRSVVGVWVAGAAVVVATIGSAAEPQFRRLAVKDYRDKMQAGWIGQIAGVSLGAPTEFQWRGQIIPADKMPRWQPKLINDAFAQDDLYVEMTFLRTLEQYGIDVSIRQAGLDFANSRYDLWCANLAGRTNLRNGIAPPDSGHPKFNKCPNDIDYQIEADYSGLISPGLPNAAVALGEKFGRLMNYGDGMYAGQFVGALYSAAFFETDPAKLCEEAVKAIPAESQYAEMVRDMVAWHRADPSDWQKTWRLAVDKYRNNPAYQKASNGDIDCKINGACVLLGLLYGDRDLEKTMTIACRGGYDSDCNPSSAGGVLFTTIGFAKLPDRFTKELDLKRKFSYTAYNVPELIDVCEKLARQIVVKYGGKIATEEGEEVFLLPVEATKPSPLELSWAPGPIAGSRFTEEEAAKITAPSLQKQAALRFPGWVLTDCGQDMAPGLRAEWGGKQNVFMTHPKDQQTGAVLGNAETIPTGKKTKLHIVVGHHPGGDFDFVLRINGKETLRRPIGKATSVDGWVTIDQDLTQFAGQNIKIELVNQPTGWFCEAAYWAEIALVSE
jgi:hypothetical protein